MTTISSDLVFAIALAFMPRWNKIAMLPIIEELGGIEALFTKITEEQFERFCRTRLTSLYRVQRDRMLTVASEELHLMGKKQVEMTTYWDNNYPQLLKECEDAPLVLFYKGSLQQLTPTALAIVGTRKASVRCRGYVDDFIDQLAKLAPALPIVSGLAYGIDITAHRAALRNQLPTFAVLGHGLNTVYPAAHHESARDIIKHNGALITEFPMLLPTHPGNFLQRNRIIAGLSQATLIAESGVKGGAVSTAHIAFSYNRDVMAIPGRPDDFFSEGCNLLIKQQIAQMAEYAKDVAIVLKIETATLKERQLQFNFFDASSEEEIILTHLQEAPKAFQELLHFTNIPFNMLQSTLLQLELQQKIRLLPGDRYEKCK